MELPSPDPELSPIPDPATSSTLHPPHLNQLLSLCNHLNGLCTSLPSSLLSTQPSNIINNPIPSFTSLLHPTTEAHPTNILSPPRLVPNSNIYLLSSSDRTPANLIHPPSISNLSIIMRKLSAH
eukprot:TRINITY_DN87899_c0_g1_i1.p1 TRINITY_DN87899_c0_g1~~TRINITY_DN87899_c0_g1_i1.p1  ORF type:complete len:145 (+),score=18.63 TRINITY_DN87899_c0_g1_i1:64-435(+)